MPDDTPGITELQSWEEPWRLSAPTTPTSPLYRWPSPGPGRGDLTEICHRLVAEPRPGPRHLASHWGAHCLLPILRFFGEIICVSRSSEAEGRGPEGDRGEAGATEIRLPGFVQILTSKRQVNSSLPASNVLRQAGMITVPALN